VSAVPTVRMVYIVDDDAAVRDSLALLLSLRGFATAVFARADDFLRVAHPHMVGCAVIDLLLQTHAPRLGVVVVTGHGDIDAARMAMKAGAVDFLEKPFDDDRLVESIEAAWDADSPQTTGADVTAKALSPRERQIVELVCQGLDNSRIGEQLGISPRTVEVHKARVMQKIGAKTFADVFRFAAGKR
jgi:two-component system, LuxR family, response regulator FixJ